MADLYDLLQQTYSEKLDKQNQNYQKGDLKSTNTAIVNKYNFNTNKDNSIFGLGDLYKKETKEIEKTLKEVKKEEAKRYKEIFKKELELQQYSTRLKNETLKRETDAYTHMYSVKLNQEQKVNSILEQQAKTYKEIGESGKISLGNLAQIYTQRREVEKLEKESIDYKYKQFKERIDKFKTGVETIIDHIFKYIDNRDNLLVWNQWEKGINDFGSQYEQNFTEIAARNGSDTQLQTHELIKSSLTQIINNSDLAKGLNFNNEVFPEITNAVQKGFMGSEATDVALSNAIDKKITPWLDTASETWVDLQYQLSDDMLMQLKGQQLLLQETREGNRILQNGVVSALLDSLEPTLLNIDANTTDVSSLTGEAQVMVASLMDNGWGKQAAVKFANEAIDAFQNPFKNLQSSSSTWQKMLAIGAVNGNDLNSTLQFATNGLAAFDNGTWQSGGAVAAGWGVPTNGLTRDTNYISDILQAGIDVNNYKNGDFKGIYQSTISNLNAYTTATQQNDNAKQNAVTDYVFDKSLIVHGNDLAGLQLKELQSIKRWLITGLVATPFMKLGDKLIDGLVEGLGKSNIIKLGSGFTSKLGSGFLSNSQNITGAGKLGIMSSGPGAILGSTAGVLAGSYLLKEGIQGVGESFNKYNTGNDTQKKYAEGSMLASAGAALGGGVGTSAILALGASNPIGWFALALGGAALAVKKYRDHLAELDDASARITQNFNNAKDVIDNETDSRKKQLLTVYDNIDSLQTTNEKLEYLKKNGIDTSNLSFSENAKNTDEVNKQLKIYLDNLIKANDENSDDAKELLDTVSVAYQNEFNTEVDNVKDAILKNYSREALTQKYGNISDKELWNYQRKALENLGYNKDEIEKMKTHWHDGPMNENELKGVLDKGAVDGKNIGSWEDHIENGNVDISAVNYALRQAGINNIELQDENNISQVLGALADDIIYINKYKKWGKSGDDKLKTNIPDEFNQKDYDTYKENILKADKSSKKLLTKAFESLGDTEAMTTWPDDLKGYKIGSSFIAYDQIAQLHKGERVLTENQNKEYTQELISGDSKSSIIQMGVQDIVIAIKNQTNEILDYLSLHSGDNTSNSSLNMFPSMGNTKVTI